MTEKGHKASKDPTSGLTKHRLRIIELISREKTNKEIAQELGVSTDTVNSLTSTIYSQLGVKTRTGAAALALRKGWIK